jgi:hypothetical protein
MDIPHGSQGSFPHDGSWLGKAGLAAAGLMVGVALGLTVSPWSAPPSPDTTGGRAALTGMPLGAPVAAADAAQAASVFLVAPGSSAPAEVQGMELCWGGDEPVRC